MNKIIFLFLNMLITVGLNAQIVTNNIYDPSNQYNNFNNRPNLNDKEVEIRGKNNELIRKIKLTNNKMEDYNLITSIADSFYLNHSYSSASLLYFQAIKLNNNLGKVKHRYNLACSLATTGDLKEAFSQLEIMISKGKFNDKKLLENERLFTPLKTDKRWFVLLNLIDANIKKIQDSLNFEINRN